MLQVRETLLCMDEPPSPGNSEVPYNIVCPYVLYHIGSTLQKEYPMKYQMMKLDSISL
jgi:hypothetical protein